MRMKGLGLLGDIGLEFRVIGPYTGGQVGRQKRSLREITWSGLQASAMPVPAHAAVILKTLNPELSIRNPEP